MSMSDDILFDSLPAATVNQRTKNWARWKPDSIHQAQRQTQTAEQTVATVSANDSEAELQDTLVRLRKHAQEKGYSDGKTAGYADGMKDGLAEGQTQGHKQGYQAGFDTGQQDGHEQAEQAAARLASLNLECAAALTQIEADVGQALIALSIRIAERVLHRTVNAEPDTILALIDDILRLDTGKSAVLKLYVNPADLTLVRDYLHDEPDTSLWRVLSDETITRGGCKAHTALGDIDATLETRWQRVVSSISGGV